MKNMSKKERYRLTIVVKKEDVEVLEKYRRLYGLRSLSEAARDILRRMREALEK